MEKDKYNLKIFLSSTFEEDVMRDAREAFRNEINARLNNIVGLLGGNAYIYDLQLGIPEGTDALKTLEICFDKIKESNCFVFILSEKYGKQNTKIFLLGDKMLPTAQIKKSPYFDIINKGIEEKLYIIELEILESENIEEQKGKRLFFFDNRIKDAYSTKIKEIITQRHEKIDSIIEFDSTDDIKEKFISYFEHFFSNETKLLNEEEQKLNLFNSSMLRYYVENKEGVALLNEYRDNDSKQVCIINGQSGSGKSTLIAKWINQNKTDKTTKYINYNIGIKGNTLRDMLAYLYKTNWGESMPPNIIYAKERILTENFYSFLDVCGKQKKTVIVLDGLNQLIVEREILNKYYWIPKILPENVKMILSTTDKTNETDFYVCNIPIVKPVEILKHILKCEGKELETETIEESLDKSPYKDSKLPILARIIYNEIVENFKYNDIKIKLIAHLNENQTIDKLYENYLNRLSKRYGYEVVNKCLTLILCSEDGLLQDDLQSIVNDKRLDDLIYMLYHEFSRDKDGKMKFSHTYLSDNIKRLFCKDEVFVHTCRNLIISRFQQRFKTESNILLWREIVYQLYEMRDGARMYSLLSDFNYAFDFFQHDQYLIVKYTSFLDKRKELMLNWKKMAKDNMQYIFVATSCVMIGEYDLALNLFSKIWHKGIHLKEKAMICEWIIQAYHGLADYEAANNFRTIYGDILRHSDKEQHEILRTHNELYRRFKENPNEENEKNLLDAEIGYYGLNRPNPNIAETYHNIATIYGAEQSEKAIAYYKEALKIYELTYGEKHSQTAETYHNLASIYAQIGENKKAFELFDKALPVLIEYYGTEHPEIAALYNNLAGLYFLQEDYENALKYSTKAYYIYKKVFGRRDAQTNRAKQNTGLIQKKIMERNDISSMQNEDQMDQQKIARYGCSMWLPIIAILICRFIVGMPKDASRGGLIAYLVVLILCAFFMYGSAMGAKRMGMKIWSMPFWFYFIIYIGIMIYIIVLMLS